MTSLCISRAICEPWTSVSDSVVSELCHWNLYLNYEIVRPCMQWFCFNVKLDLWILFYAHVTYWKLHTCYMLPKYHGYVICCPNSLRWFILQNFWVFMTTWQCHGNYRICHDIYARSYIHAAKISSHTGYTSKQKGCLIPTYITKVHISSHRHVTYPCTQEMSNSTKAHISYQLQIHPI